MAPRVKDCLRPPVTAVASLVGQPTEPDCALRAAYSASRPPVTRYAVEAPVRAARSPPWKDCTTPPPFDEDAAAAALGHLSELAGPFSATYRVTIAPVSTNVPAVEE